MTKEEVRRLLEELLEEDGYSNPLYLSTDDKGEKYKAALYHAIELLGEL